MKKLTAGIFTVLLGIVSVNAADAAIASKGYVDGLNTTVTNAIEKLNGADTVEGSVAQKIKAAVDPVSAKANSNETEIGTLKTTVGNDDSGLVKKVADLQSEINGLTGDNGGVASQIDAALKDYTTTTNLEKDYAKKAATLAGYGIGDAYTKGEVDTAVDAKQAKSTAAYSLGNADGGWTALTPAEQAALQSGADTTKIGQIATNTTAIGTLNTTVNKLDGDVTTDGSVKKQISDAISGVNTNVTGLTTRVNTLETTVGDADSGLVKKVNDNTGAIATNTGAIGTLSGLTTTEKTNLVGAINEVKTAADNASAKIGALPDGTATVKAYIDNQISSTTGEDSQLATDVASLKTTVGNDESGLVADVAALQGTVGNAENGLVKDVAANADAISTIKTNLGLLAGAQIPTVCTTSADGCTLVYRGSSFIWEPIERAAGEQ